MFKPPDPEIHISGNGIGQTLFHQLLDQLNHLFNVIGCLGLLTGRPNTQPGHILVIDLDIGLGNLFPAFPLAIGSINDLVIDIGKIPNIPNLISSVLQKPADHIKKNRTSCMPKMT